MDFLTATLSLCIGTVVAWLLAIYTKRGMHLLLWNTLLGIVGAALCALAIVWTAPTLTVIGLVVAGPLCSLLVIVAGNAMRRALLQARSL